MPLVTIAGLAPLGGQHPAYCALPLLLPDNPPVSLQCIEHSAIRLATEPGASGPRGETRPGPGSDPLPARRARGQWNGLLVAARGR